MNETVRVQVTQVASDRGLLNDGIRPDFADRLIALGSLGESLFRRPQIDASKDACCPLGISLPAGLLAFWLLFSVATTCEAQRFPKAGANRPFRENVTFPVDSNLRKRIGTVEDLLADQRWNEAIGILQEIEQTENKSLMLVQPGRPGKVAAYVNVTTRCNVLLSRISAEGRTVYRQKVDPQAKRWFENWQRTRDEAELLKIVRQTFLSRYGDEALLALGEVAWDRGDFSAARLWWEQLIPLADDAIPADYPTVLRYPDTDIDRAAILARIVMCSIVERDSIRGADELSQFAARYPQAEGRIAGQQGRFVEILQRILEDTREWKPRYSAGEVATFGLSPERFRRIPESVDVGAMKWVRSLSPHLLPPQNERRPFQSDPLSYHPVVYDNSIDKIVLVNDADAIRAWNLLTGEPAWQPEGHDSAVIYPSIPDEPTLAPRNCVGMPHYTMTIADDRLYARMGSPVSCSSIAELHPDSLSDLVCLDLKQEGKLVWKIAAHELLPGDAPWRYEGTPLVVAGRAYVALCCRRPQLELVIACLDASDGRLEWQRPIGAFRASVDDSKNRVSHLLLTAGGGRVFLSTDAGGIVALDAREGRLEWAVSYESRLDEGAISVGEASQKTLRPALYHAGYLFVAPADSGSAYCIEADSGRIHWTFAYSEDVSGEMIGSSPPNLRQSRDREWRNLLGIAPGGAAGRLIVSGSALWAVDIASGRIAWSGNEGISGRGGKIEFGRGLIADDQVLFPTRESIEFFELRTGKHLRTFPLKTPESDQQGGNLTLAGGMLLVAQPNRLAAYGEFSRLKERIENGLTRKPNDEAWQIQMAELEAAEGRPAEAIARFRAILTPMNSDDPVYLPIRRKLTRLWQEMGSAESRDSNPAAARDHWREALAVTNDRTQRVDLLFDLARAEEALNHPEASTARLQEILNAEGLASVPRGSLTAGHDASREISRLIAERGRSVYREVEAAATAEFAMLAKAADKPGLRRLIVKYPQAKAVVNARKWLVQRYRDAGEILEACAVLDELRQEASDDRAYVDTTLSMIELLETAKATNATTRLWQMLAAPKASMEVAFAGKNHDLHELATSCLQQEASGHRSRPGFVERSWSRELASDSRMIIPQCEPPSEELAVVLICSPDPKQSNSWRWQCLDWRTGQIRWEETSSSSIQIVVWTPFRLLIGTSQGWQARTAETGRQIWEQRSGHETTPLFVRQSNGSIDGTIWPMLFDPDQGIRLLDSNDGQIIANLKPPGRLHQIVGVTSAVNEANQVGSLRESGGTNQPAEAPNRVFGQATGSIVLLFQTIKPTRIWRACASSARDFWSLEELAIGGELWQTTPFALSNRLISLTTDHHLVGYRMENPPAETGHSGPVKSAVPTQPLDRWEFSNFSVGFGGPVALSQAGELLLIVDHSQLASFDPASGTRKWSTGLAEIPLKTPVAQVCVDSDSLFATSQGMFRGISIFDGARRWERYLGNSSIQWRTTLVWTGSGPVDDLSRKTGRGRSLIAAWPLDPIDDSDPAIWLCDTETGAVVQQLKTDATPQEFVLRRDGQGLLCTGKSLSGMRFSPAVSMAEISAKTGDHGR